jgi:hypothetical protein
MKFFLLIMVLLLSELLSVSRERYIYTVAGNGNFGFSGDGGLATEATLNYPWGVSVSFDGKVYIADYANSRIRVVSVDGTINNFAGNGIGGYAGDNGPATQAQLFNPTGTAVALTGEVYIADYNNNVVRIVYTNGTINTFAGTGVGGSSGDNGPATSAQLYYPFDVAVSADGKVFIADFYNNRVRLVVNGIISTYAGNGAQGYYGDGGIATSAALNWPQGVSLGPSGELYIADNGNHVRIVYPNDTIYTFAGTGSQQYSGDGGPAINAGMSTWAVAASPTGEVYIADGFNSRIRVIYNNGTVDTFAGNGNRASTGDGGPATEASLFAPTGVALGPNGGVYIADEQASRVRIVSCGPGTTGFNCQLIMCYGVNLTSPNICSGYGICVGPNTCNCFSGHTGGNCSDLQQPSNSSTIMVNSFLIVIFLAFLIV